MSHASTCRKQSDGRKPGPPFQWEREKGFAAWSARRESQFNSSSLRPRAGRPCARPRRCARCALKVGSSLQWMPDPGLHGEAGIDFLQLGRGLLRLLVVAGPGVGGGEVDETGTKFCRAAGDRLVAPFDRLLPLREMGVEVANIVLPKRHARIARAQPKRGFDAREAVLGCGRETSSRSRVAHGRRRCFDRRRSPSSASAIAGPHWRFREEDHAFAHMGRTNCQAERPRRARSHSSARAMSPVGSLLRETRHALVKAPRRPIIAGTLCGSSASARSNSVDGVLPLAFDLVA